MKATTRLLFGCDGNGNLMIPTPRSIGGVMPLMVAIVTFMLSCMGIANAQSDRFTLNWPDTDFSRSLIDLDEVISGGPPKDGIPAITEPSFISSGDENRLSDREPVITYIPPDGRPRAYPIRYLMWHEIVNDVIEGDPVSITFCPLCNTGIVFDPRVSDQTLEFGVSGLLRHSDMIMYDRQTESWWQQATGKAIVGRFVGTQLKQLPARMEGWSTFRAAYPDGLVMDEPASQRDYGANPYLGYDSSRPFLYGGENPPHGIDPLERVVRVGNRAWPLTRLRAQGQISEAGIILSWTEGQASALDAGQIGVGREVGNIRVRNAQGQDVVHDIPFAFAFHAFHPDGIWMLGE